MYFSDAEINSVAWAEHSEAQRTGSDVLGYPLVSPIYHTFSAAIRNTKVDAVIRNI
ncbi:hypothetical protein NTGBS_880048 [Candidatus Nitrotoga sp. BS]|nr:hypothetical protein NTGBS_880048 [Candidatus Nitrotoga sp. BS]